MIRRTSAFRVACACSPRGAFLPFTVFIVSCAFGARRQANAILKLAEFACGTSCAAIFSLSICCGGICVARRTSARTIVSQRQEKRTRPLDADCPWETLQLIVDPRRAEQLDPMRSRVAAGRKGAAASKRHQLRSDGCSKAGKLTRARRQPRQGRQSPRVPRLPKSTSNSRHSVAFFPPMNFALRSLGFRNTSDACQQ